MHRTAIVLAGLAAGVFLLASCGPAAAALDYAAVVGTMTAGPDVGQAVSLAFSFDVDPNTGALSITTSQDEAVVTVGGAPLLSVPAYVWGGGSSPGSASYVADPGNGRFDLTLVYNFVTWSPNAGNTQSSLILSGSAPVPLFSAPGVVDPAFFQDFTGSGSGASFYSGFASQALTGYSQLSYSQSSLDLAFDVGVPEPGSLALLGFASLLAIGFGASRRAARPPA
ncbi:MAG: PEP-CTERM sorting domain-containing protein [Proteobacteria bacterium]|nr:PEP-CTERM sorting domain-containing protein [Pseudomonadota bacterium]